MYVFVLVREASSKLLELRIRDQTWPAQPHLKFSAVIEVERFSKNENNPNDFSKSFVTKGDLIDSAGDDLVQKQPC